MRYTKQPKFELGVVSWTKGISELLSQDEAFAKFVKNSLRRHAIGDWGDVSGEDRQENELSINRYHRLFSAYNYGSKAIWIITDADRSGTTILFPKEY